MFAEVSYERLNKIRLQGIKFTDKKVSLRANATAAYEAETGVKKFVRKFDFTAPDNFVVRDEFETDKPQMITAFFHSDNVINKISDKMFIFEAVGTNLALEILEPSAFDAKIEKNILTAPGKPGSVDKGEHEERGVRLAVSSKEKVLKLNLETRLKIRFQ